MKSTTLVLAALALLCGGVGQAEADILLDQPLNTGPTGPQFGLFSSGLNSGSGGRQEIASGFSLASDALVEEVQWYGAYRFGDTPSAATDFLIRFFADSGDRPGTVISQQDITVAGFQTGFDNAGGLPILAYDSAISPVSINAGSIYWISILENDPSTPFADHWIWQFTDVEGIPESGSNNDGLSWGGPVGPPGSGASMAFILSGESANPVPEPSSLALFAVGAVALAAWRWRRGR